MQTYLIPEANMELLQEKIAKMQKRAKKLACEPVKLIVLGSKIVKKKNEELKLEYDVTYLECKIEGERPSLNGWRLIAAVEPTDNGEMLVREVPGETCPDQYRGASLVCDHCQYIRRRNTVYVLCHTDGTYKQVGSKCLADFLGGASHEQILAAAEYSFDLADMCVEAGDEHWGCGSRGPIRIPIHHFVAVVSVLIRKLGWRSRTEAMKDEFGPQATASIAWSICTARPGDPYIKQLVQERGLHADDNDAKLAAEAIEWGGKIDSATAANSYLYDLGVCCRQTSVTYKQSGFTASAIIAYQKTLAVPRPNQVRHQSEHLGTIGQYIEVEVTVIGAKPMEGKYEATFVRFRDEAGNSLIWRASGTPEWAHIGANMKVRGKVKAHEEWNGINQTKLERVAPMEEPALAS